MVPGIIRCWPVLNIPRDGITPAYEQAQNMGFTMCSRELPLSLCLLLKRFKPRNIFSVIIIIGFHDGEHAVCGPCSRRNIVNIEEVLSSEISALSYQTRQYNNPEYHNINDVHPYIKKTVTESHRDTLILDMLYLNSILIKFP
jgi:hypothetical protein